MTFKSPEPRHIKSIIPIFTFDWLPLRMKLHRCSFSDLDMEVFDPIRESGCPPPAAAPLRRPPVSSSAGERALMWAVLSSE